MGQCISIGANGPAKSRRRGTAATRAMASGTPMKVMIAGAPAAGKGTQCENIVRDYNLVHISVGDLLRAEVAAGTDAGKRAKGFMDAGALVPNEVVVDMVKNRLAEQDVVERGWLLDGYPRSGEQAEAIEEAGIRPDCFLLINVPDEVLVERVTGRRSDPETGAIYHLKFKPPPAEVVDRLVQRSDDTEEMVVPRLKTYHDNVNAVVGYYKDVIVEVCTAPRRSLFAVRCSRPDSLTCSFVCSTGGREQEHGRRVRVHQKGARVGRYTLNAFALYIYIYNTEHR